MSSLDSVKHSPARKFDYSFDNMHDRLHTYREQKRQRRETLARWASIERDRIAQEESNWIWRRQKAERQAQEQREIYIRALAYGVLPPEGINV